MLSKPLVFTALLFQVIGVVWGLVAGFQAETLNQFFAAPNWPIFLGFVLLIVAVLQSKNSGKVDVETEPEPSPEPPEDPNQNQE
ncbi:MAG: hypothetical protein Q8P83_03765 [bacterium]|nr:hypothetical protein [bacterium]